jgi:hypothetical protein
MELFTTLDFKADRRDDFVVAEALTVRSNAPGSFPCRCNRALKYFVIEFIAKFYS